MGTDDLIEQGKKFVEENQDKIAEFLKSDEAEGISDKVLDAVADLAKKVAPDEHDATIDGVRDNIDKSVGTD